MKYLKIISISVLAVVIIYKVSHHNPMSVPPYNNGYARDSMDMRRARRMTNNTHGNNSKVYTSWHSNTDTVNDSYKISSTNEMDIYPATFSMADCGVTSECGRFRKLFANWPQHKPRAAIYALTGGPKGGRLLKMLTTLFDKFNDEYHYPIIIFHEAEFHPEIVKEQFDRPNIFYQQITFPQPLHFPEPDPVSVCDRLTDTGYRHMCRFHAGMVFTHPIIQGLEYVMRIDSDSELLPPRVTYDLFSFMKEHQLIYGYRTLVIDGGDCVKNLWELAETYARERSIKPTFLHCWPRKQNFYNNFDISRLDFWQGKQYQDFFHHVDNAGGIYRYRWGDSPIKGLAISLFVPPQSIHMFDDVGYHHGYFHCHGRVVSNPQPKPLNRVLSCLNASDRGTNLRHMWTNVRPIKGPDERTSAKEKWCDIRR